MSRRRVQTFIFVGSIVLAFLLQLTPLPQAFLPLKPYWIALVLIYWSIEAPERMGLGFAFLIGLAGDLLTGQLLGMQRDYRGVFCSEACAKALGLRNSTRMSPQALLDACLGINKNAVFICKT